MIEKVVFPSCGNLHPKKT